MRPLHEHSAGKGSNNSKDTGAWGKHSLCDLLWVRGHCRNSAITLPDASTVPTSLGSDGVCGVAMLA